MPQYVDEFDEDDDYANNGESNAMREVRKALRAAEKRSKELEAEVNQFRAQARQGVLSKTLEAAGLNPKVAEFIPNDVQDEEGISRWLAEYGDVFGAPKAESAPQPASPRFEQATSQGSAPAGDESQLLALIKGASSPAELSQILHGNPNGPSF